MPDGSVVVAVVVPDGSAVVAVVVPDGSSVVAIVVLDELVEPLVAAVSLEVGLVGVALVVLCLLVESTAGKSVAA